MYNIIPVIIIIVSLAVIIAILVRKASNVGALDVDQLPEEKQKRVKRTLIENKLERVLRKVNLALTTAGERLGFLKKFLTLIKNKIFTLEEKYYWRHKRIIQSEIGKSGELKERVSVLLKEAEALKTEERLMEAERKYIEVIELDPRNITSYRGLGDIYLKQKNFDEARQALEYVLELIKRKRGRKLVEDYINLGLIYKELGENMKALGGFQRALALEPNNPRNLDLLCEMSIIVKDKALARDTCKRLREANPENQKLKEFEEKIKEL